VGNSAQDVWPRRFVNSCNGSSLTVDVDDSDDKDSEESNPDTDGSEESGVMNPSSPEPVKKQNLKVTRVRTYMG